MTNKRRYDRYRLENLDDAVVEFSTLSDNDQTLSRPIFNLSYKGIGFHPAEGDAERIPISIELPATLCLRNHKIPIAVEVIYQTSEIAGARISPKNDADIRRIIRFINPMELGLSLRKIDPNAVLLEDADRKMTWYAGKNNTELVVWRDSRNNLLEFRLIFYLYTVVGIVKEKKILTADLNPVELGYIPIYETWPEQVAQWHEGADREALQLAAEVLENADGLSDEDRQDISSLIFRGD